MNKDMLRIVIAVTETSPVQALWRAALERLSDDSAELTALFLADDRWHRAASLPFTREIARIGGAVADFTLQRAEMLNEKAVTRARQRMERLAAEANRALIFEVLSESDLKRIQELAGGGNIVLIASSVITSQPIYAHITQLNCRIELIETTEEDRESE